MTLEIIQCSEDWVAIRLTGSLTSANSDALLTRLQSFQRRKCAHAYLLDLASLELLDSSGIGALVASGQYLRKHAAELVLVGLQGRALQTIRIARADKIFALHADLAGAIEALKQAPSMRKNEPLAAGQPAAAII